MSRISGRISSRVFSRFSSRLSCWKAGACGSTAIEYSLIAGGIAVAISAVVLTLGDTVLTDLYSGLSDIISGE
jgi:Flp pilus assembly pilin Flp